jgi:hypothetical protein
VIETDSTHQPIVVEDLDADWLLALCEDTAIEGRRVERRRLRYALQWARMHPADPADIAQGRVETVGGDGALGRWRSSPPNRWPRRWDHRPRRAGADLRRPGPGLRTDRADAVDQHDPPAWMRELVILRDPCGHPHCQTDVRSCDLGLIEWPHGPTAPGNLAPLRRRHHRAKTRRHPGTAPCLKILACPRPQSGAAV